MQKFQQFYSSKYEKTGFRGQLQNTMTEVQQEAQIAFEDEHTQKHSRK